MKICAEKLDVEYRIINTSSIGAIEQLEIECFGNHSWSIPSIAADMTKGNSIWIAAFIGQNLIGYATGSMVCAEAELNRIAVSKSYRHIDIGRNLLSILINQFEINGCQQIFLEVRESNTVAIKLYSSAGFNSCGIRKNYYSDPVENALLMKRG